VPDRGSATGGGSGHQRTEDVDHQRLPGRLDLPPRQHVGGSRSVWIAGIVTQCGGSKTFLSSLTDPDLDPTFKAYFASGSFTDPATIVEPFLLKKKPFYQKSKYASSNMLLNFVVVCFCIREAGSGSDLLG